MNQFQFKTPLGTGSPRQARQARFSPWLDLGFQYALIRNNWSKIFGVEYWALPGSYSPWRPCKILVKNSRSIADDQKNTTVHCSAALKYFSFDISKNISFSVLLIEFIKQFLI